MDVTHFGLSFWSFDVSGVGEASDYHASAYFVSFSALLLLLFVDFLGV